MGSIASTDNPNEFWLYETWVDEAAVQAHETGDAFKQYKETLRPLVEPESVIFGNTVPIKVLGYGPLPTTAQARPVRWAIGLVVGRGSTFLSG